MLYYITSLPQHHVPMEGGGLVKPQGTLPSSAFCTLHPWGNVGTTGAGSKALLGPDVHSWYPPTPVAERACVLCTCQPYTQHHLLMWAGKHKLYTPQTLLLGGSVCPIHYPMYVRSTTHSPHSPFLLLSISMIIILNLTYFFKYLLVYVLPFMYSNEVFSGYQCSHNRN